MDVYRKGSLSAIICQSNTSRENFEKNDEGPLLSNSLSRRSPCQSNFKAKNVSKIDSADLPLLNLKTINSEKCNNTLNAKKKNIPLPEGDCSGVQKIKVKKKLRACDDANESLTNLRDPEPEQEKTKREHLSKKKKRKLHLEDVPCENKKNLEKENEIFENKNNINILSKEHEHDSQMETDDHQLLTIYVGNLPLSYDHKKVVKLFSKFGKVINARVRCIPIPSLKISKKKAAITKKFHPNRNSLAAYVVFKNKESALKAVAANGMVVDGHHLRLDFAEPSKRDIRKSVFVGGLPFDVTDDELWDHFKDCGEIESVRVIRDKNTSMGKGIGYVNFKSTASVELALHLNTQKLKNRIINVERCFCKKPKKIKIDVHKKSVFKNRKEIKKTRFKKNQSNSEFCDFQGTKAEQKRKKKKFKLTKESRLKNKIKCILGST